VHQVQTQACDDGEFRISGLQLPGVAVPNASTSESERFSVMQTTTYRWSLAEDLTGFAEARVGGIALYRPKLEEMDEDAAIDAVRSSGLAVSSLSWVGGFTGSDGRKLSEALFDAREAVRFAAAVGAGTIAAFSGSAGAHIDRHARRLLNDGLTALCDFAADADVRVAIHPFAKRGCRGRSVVGSLDEAVDAVLAAERPNLGLVLDLEELHDELDLLSRAGDLVPLVHVVRISDRRHRHDRRRHFLDRVARTNAIVAALCDAGYDGPVEFDFWTGDDRATCEYVNLLGECRSRFEAIMACLARAV
jgi:sugar phosphate isomerase/epimerase